MLRVSCTNHYTTTDWQIWSKPVILQRRLLWKFLKLTSVTLTPCILYQSTHSGLRRASPIVSRQLLEPRPCLLRGDGDDLAGGNYVGAQCTITASVGAAVERPTDMDKGVVTLTTAVELKLIDIFKQSLRYRIRGSSRGAGRNRRGG